jgi:hypothetical protein
LISDPSSCGVPTIAWRPPVAVAAAAAAAAPSFFFVHHEQWIFRGFMLSSIHDIITLTT